MPRGRKSGSLSRAETLDRHEAGDSIALLAALEGVSESGIRQRLAHERKRRAAAAAAPKGPTVTRKRAKRRPASRPPQTVIQSISFSSLNRAIEELERVERRAHA